MSENKRVIYRNYCRTCKVHFESDIPLVVGKPCPNPNCPLGNPIITHVWWQRKWVKPVAIAGGLTVSGILLFNVGGWGAFALDLAISFLVQAIIALILFGALLAVFMIALREILKPFLFNRYILSGIFLIAAVLALPLLPFMLHRPVDIYDLVQTIALGIAANLLTKPLEKRLSG